MARFHGRNLEGLEALLGACLENFRYDAFDHASRTQCPMISSSDMMVISTNGNFTALFAHSMICQAQPSP